MVKEDYVSFEIAKLLKEKGFDGICQAYYDTHGFSMFNGKGDNYKTRPLSILAPTTQMAMKWLREEYNIFIHISITQGSMYDSINELVFGEPEYRYKIERLYSYDEIYSRESYDSYKETIDAAIKYVLKNLI